MALKPGPEQHHTDPMQSALDGTNDPNADFQTFFDQRAAQLAALPDDAVSEYERQRRLGQAFADAVAAGDESTDPDQQETL